MRSKKTKPSLATQLFLWLVLTGGLAVSIWIWQLQDALPLSDWKSWLVFFPLLLFFWLALIVLAVVLQVLLRQVLLRSETYEFRQAAKCAGGPGNVIRDGQITFWFSWPTEHTALFRQQLELSRVRFSELWGVPVAVDRPLRVFCFKSKLELDEYFRRRLLTLHHVDGLFVPGKPRRLIAHISRELTRPFDQERTLRVLFAYYFLEIAKGFLPSPWLNFGVGNTVACGGNRDELARLNRKILAAIAVGTVLDAPALFGLKPRKLLAKLKRGDRLPDFALYQRHHAQSCSVVEYLSGADAPPQRRRSFVAFLKDLKPRDSYEQVFERHFGHSFAQLLRDWRQWVEGQGLGTHQPPPPKIRKALLDWVVPFVADPDADWSERILAIRDMGMAGYLAGAETLIGLLKSSNAELRQEAQWALENISGISCGQGMERWQDWWQSLPDEPVPIDG